MSNSFTKSDFPVFDAYKGLVYLDNSATQQKPAAVLERVEKYYREENANPLRGLYDLASRRQRLTRTPVKLCADFSGLKALRR